MPTFLATASARRITAHAREGNLRPRRRPHPPQAIEPGAKSDEPAEMHAVRQVKLANSNGASSCPQARLFPRRNRREHLGIRARESRSAAARFLRGGRKPRRAPGHRPLLHLPRTRQADRHRRARHPLQRPFPLGRPAGTRNRGGPGGRTPSHPHPLLLARGRPEFNHVNIMAVAHGTDRDLVRAHKAAIDDHLRAIGMPFSYTNVFWGGRSEIKPSEIAPPPTPTGAAAADLDPDWR
jgi:hypothetical protein